MNVSPKVKTTTRTAAVGNCGEYQLDVVAAVC